MPAINKQKNHPDVEKYLAAVKDDQRRANKLEDIHIPTLKKLIKQAIKSPEVQGAETIK